MEKSSMSPADLSALFRAKAHYWWHLLHVQNGVGVKPTPALKFNTRLRTTAGQVMWAKPEIVELNNNFVWYHTLAMLETILPHELAHSFAFINYKDTGHGAGWKASMRSIGLHPERCHDLDNPFEKPK